MNKEKLLAILQLQITKGVGSILARKLIFATGNIEQIFREKPTTLQKIYGIGPHITKQLFDKETRKLAEKEFEYITKNNTSYTYFLEDDYPKNLEHCVDAPILLFKQGNINLTNSKIISIVGTRNITSYGRSVCEKLIEELTIYNPIIVSGFAYGIDICAHKQAIKNNLQTIAILGHGLEKIYPKAHKKYIDQVYKNGGFITEFWHNKNPMRENFLKRNRIIAGISKATIIIESAEKGGALVTADIANSYNKEVFAVCGRTTDNFSKGCNNLIKNNKAHLITSTNDIVEILNWDIDKQQQQQQQQLFVKLNSQEQKVYDYLNKQGKQLLDVISLECEIPTYKLSSILLQMELKGVLKPLTGKMFEII